MKNNKFDIVTDLVKHRINLAIGEAQKRFKNTNPYRQRAVTSEERLMDYANITPEQMEFAKQNFGEEVVSGYTAEMEKLKEKFGAR